MVRVANELGFEATCNRDRAHLGITDKELFGLVLGEDRILATDNVADFRAMYEGVSIHPGLIELPGTAGRAGQQRLAHDVLAWIVTAALSAGEQPASFMVNKFVERDEAGAWTVRDMSDPSDGVRPHRESSSG